MKPTTNFKYTKKHEYCPASGKYDKNTVIQRSATVGSEQTLRKPLKEKTYLEDKIEQNFTLKGSTWSHVIVLDLSRNLSGSDSGTATRIKKTSKIATAVANAITKFLL